MRRTGVAYGTPTRSVWSARRRRTGRVGQAGSELAPGCAEHVLTSCLLRPDTLLSRSVLDRVRPLRPAPDLPDLRWLQHVNEDRAAALEQFVTGWYPATGQPQRQSAAPAPSRPLPGSLQQLYRLAEERPGVLGCQNHIMPEHELHTDPLGELLVFGVENQGSFFWGLLWTLDDPVCDPTVWFREFDDVPVAEEEPLSGFLIQFSLYEAAMSADYTALALGLSVNQVHQLTVPLQPVPLRPFWPGLPPASKSPRDSLCMSPTLGKTAGSRCGQVPHTAALYRPFWALTSSGRNSTVAVSNSPARGRIPPPRNTYVVPALRDDMAPGDVAAFGEGAVPAAG